VSTSPFAKSWLLKKQTEITEIANSLKVSKTLNVVDLQI
jgi:hypothetical protein